MIFRAQFIYREVYDVPLQDTLQRNSAHLELSYRGNSARIELPDRGNSARIELPYRGNSARIELPCTIIIIK